MAEEQQKQKSQVQPAATGDQIAAVATAVCTMDTLRAAAAAVSYRGSEGITAHFDDEAIAISGLPVELRIKAKEVTCTGK